MKVHFNESAIEKGSPPPIPAIINEDESKKWKGLNSILVNKDVFKFPLD
jgi:hypothetical protein